MTAAPFAPQSALAIILARAGSKGLPGKNMRPVAGKPCARWTIDAALASMHVALVAVSTDDPDLLALARTLGPRVLALPRPLELASDTATIDAAARAALITLIRDHAVSHALNFASPTLPIVILYANVPIRPRSLIDDALALLTSTACDSVQSYAPVGKHHPWWTARLDPASAQVAPWEGDVLNHNIFRRQDLPPAYIPDGGVIALTRRSLMLELPAAQPGPHQFFGVDRRGIISRSDNPREDAVVDIDTEIDLLVADAILRSRTQ